MTDLARKYCRYHVIKKIFNQVSFGNVSGNGNNKRKNGDDMI
jgi:hypothetical protein